MGVPRRRIVCFAAHELADRVERDAFDERRSVSQIIEFILEDHYKPADGATGTPTRSVPVGSHPTRRPPSKPDAPQLRRQTTRCPHGNPVGTYCKRCEEEAT